MRAASLKPAATRMAVEPLSRGLTSNTRGRPSAPTLSCRFRGPGKRIAAPKRWMKAAGPAPERRMRGAGKGDRRPEAMEEGAEAGVLNAPGKQGAPRGQHPPGRHPVAQGSAGIEQQTAGVFRPFDIRLQAVSRRRRG